MEHSSTAFHRPTTRGLRVETATIYERGGQYPRPPEPPPRLFRKCVTERDLGNFFSVVPHCCSLKVCNGSPPALGIVPRGARNGQLVGNESQYQGRSYAPRCFALWKYRQGDSAADCLRPVCGDYYLVNCWRSLRVVRAICACSRVRVGWLRPGLSDGDCASAEIVGLKGSFCTPAAWRERRNLQGKGSANRGHETE